MEKFIKFICGLAVCGLVAFGFHKLVDKDEIEDVIVGYYRDLHPYDKEKVNQEVLKAYLVDECSTLAERESMILKWMEQYDIPMETISALIPQMLQPANDLMEYPFDKMQEACFFDVVDSDDGKIRTFTWYEGRGMYNGYDHKVLVSTGGGIADINFEHIHNEGIEYDLGEFQRFKIFTIPLDGKTYYLFEIHNLKPSASINTAEISIYTIENGDLVKQTMFNTNKELINEIWCEYQWDDDNGTRKWLFDYDTNSQTIYVPLVGNEDNSLWLTNKYLLYKWDGENFTYKGIGKHWSK